MRSRQRKPRLGVIEIVLDTEPLRRMTAIAFGAELSIVHILCPVTAYARLGRLAIRFVLRVAGLTTEPHVLTGQGVAA